MILQFRSYVSYFYKMFGHRIDTNLWIGLIMSLGLNPRHICIIVQYICFDLLSVKCIFIMVCFDSRYLYLFRLQRLDYRYLIVSFALKIKSCGKIGSESSFNQRKKCSASYLCIVKETKHMKGIFKFICQKQTYNDMVNNEKWLKSNNIIQNTT